MLGSGKGKAGWTEQTSGPVQMGAGADDPSRVWNETSPDTETGALWGQMLPHLISATLSLKRWEGGWRERETDRIRPHWDYYLTKVEGG